MKFIEEGPQNCFKNRQNKLILFIFPSSLSSQFCVCVNCFGFWNQKFIFKEGKKKKKKKNGRIHLTKEKEEKQNQIGKRIWQNVHQQKGKEEKKGSRTERKKIKGIVAFIGSLFFERHKKDEEKDFKEIRYQKENLERKGVPVE